MTVIVEDFNSSVAASTLKEKMIIVLDVSRNDYVRIGKVTKVKTGKHGAAKVMVVGKNIRTGAKAEVSYSGSNKVYVVVPVKKTYTLVEIDEDEDCIYADPFMMSGMAEMETLHLNEIDPNSALLLKNANKSLDKNDSVITFATISYPRLIMIDDVNVVTKKSMASKRGPA